MSVSNRTRSTRNRHNRAELNRYGEPMKIRGHTYHVEEPQKDEPKIADVKKTALDKLLDLPIGKANFEQLARAYISAKDEVERLANNADVLSKEAEQAEAAAKEAVFKAENRRKMARNVHAEMLGMKDIVSEIEDEMRRKARGK